ncbi:MAG: protein kinase family protein [Streptosporangiaceae bacterium]
MGPESDVFSLGSVLTFAATGHGPFDAPYPAVINRILLQPPDLHRLPSSLHDVITGCLEKNPGSRPSLENLLVRLGSAKRVSRAGARARAVAIDSTTLKVDVGFISRIAFSPDGRLLAVSGSVGGIYDNRGSAVQLIDTSTRSLVGPPIKEIAAPVRDVRFSDDGYLLQIACVQFRNASRLVDVATRETVRLAIDGHDGLYWPDVVLSPDGRRLVTIIKDRTCLWDAASRRLIGIPYKGSTPREVTFSPDGRFLATDSGFVSLCDTSTRPVASHRLKRQRSSANAALFSPDSRLIAACLESKAVQLWDAVTRAPHGPEFAVDTGMAPCMAFSPDSRLLAVAGRNPVFSVHGAFGRPAASLCDINGAEPTVRPLPGLNAEVSRLAFSPDGRLLVGRESTMTGPRWVGDVVHMWDTATGQPVPGFSGRVIAVESMAFSRGIFAVGSADRTVVLWDTATLRPAAPPLDDHAVVISFSPDGRLLVTAAHDTLKLWDLNPLRG